MNKSIPNLSTKGFVNSAPERVDLLLSYFIASEHSQSDLYHSKITSLPYLVKTYGSDPRRLSDEVQSALNKQFLRYFEGADVRVDFSYIDTTINTGPYKIEIAIVALDSNGVRVNIAKDLEIINSTFREIAKRNNEGVSNG